MKQNYSFAKRVSAIAATSSLKSFLKSTFRPLLFICLLAIGGNAWGAASTISDDAYLKGTVSFENIGSLSAQQTYWFNGIKLYAANNTDGQKAGGDKFTSTVKYPGYVNSVEAGNKWGSYQMSGLLLQRHRFSVRVKGEGDLVLVVDCNQKDGDPIPNLKALIDDVGYATNYSNTAATGTSASFKSVCESGKGRYTLTMKVTKDMLSKSNDEVVICFFYDNSGSGEGKMFVYESVTFTPSVSSYTVTYEPNGGTCDRTSDTYTGEALTLPTPDRGGYNFTGWSDGTNTYNAGASYTPTGDVTLTAQWTPKPANVFTFSYGEKDKAYQTVEFTQVGTTNEWQIKHFVFPDVKTNQACYVGVNGNWYNDGGLGSNNAKSADLYFWNMPLALLQSDNACSVCNQLNWDMNSSNGHKAIGTLRIFDNYSDDNLFVGFVPDGYGLMFGNISVH